MSKFTRRGVLTGAAAVIALLAAAIHHFAAWRDNSKPQITNFDADASIRTLWTEDNIAPRVGFFPVSDGIKLRYAEFDPEGHPRGAILLDPGKDGTIDNFQSLATAYAKDGWKVFAPEPRGQGGSGRELDDTSKLYVTSFDKYRDDQTAFITRIVNGHVEASKPFIIVAHSMMAAAVIPSLQHNQLHVDGFVALAPMIEPNRLPTSGLMGVWTRVYLYFKVLIGSGQSIPKGSRGIWLYTPEDNPLTNYGLAFAKWQHSLRDHPQFDIRDATYAWALAAERNAAILQKIPHRSLAVPTRVFLAGEDSLVNNASSRLFFESKCKPDSCSITVLAGAKHDLELGGPSVIEQIVSGTAQLAASVSPAPAASSLLTGLKSKD